MSRARRRTFAVVLSAATLALLLLLLVTASPKSSGLGRLRTEPLDVRQRKGPLADAGQGFPRCSVHVGPRREVVVRRGVLELATGSEAVYWQQRDGWLVMTVDGAGVGGSFPPRTFWYPSVQHAALPLAIQTGRPGAKAQLTLVQVPLVLPAILLSVTCAWLWWPLLRRVRSGACRKCGYDLTGNVSGRCPECGVPISGQESGLKPGAGVAQAR